MIEAAANGTPAALAAAADCGNLPDFVPVPEKAEVTSCVSGPDGIPNHVSGSVVYLSDDKPRALIGWSREQANASGLAQRYYAPRKYQAGETGERSIMVIAEPYQGRTRVTVNWGREVR